MIPEKQSAPEHLRKAPLALRITAALAILLASPTGLREPNIDGESTIPTASSDDRVPDPRNKQGSPGHEDRSEKKSDRYPDLMRDIADYFTHSAPKDIPILGEKPNAAQFCTFNDQWYRNDTKRGTPPMTTREHLHEVWAYIDARPEWNTKLTDSLQSGIKLAEVANSAIRLQNAVPFTTKRELIPVEPRAFRTHILAALTKEPKRGKDGRIETSCGRIFDFVYRYLENKGLAPKEIQSLVSNMVIGAAKMIEEDLRSSDNKASKKELARNAAYHLATAISSAIPDKY